VTQVVDPTTFHEASLPLEWRYTHQYQGWNLLWISAGKITGSSVIEAYDPTTLLFKLTSPHEMKVGDVFEVYPSGTANWNIHDNTITGCQIPVVLDNYGSVTTRFCINMIDRGGAIGVKAAVTVGGCYQLIGNQITGFDEPGSCGLSLLTDKQGKPLPNIYRDNLLIRCTVGISESKPGLWKTATKDRNDFKDCGAEVGK
jgi:hypothetical protein